MKRKKSGGGGANWMDTYGDMVTLLLCFFVLLFSMSQISETNLKALVMSFNPDAVDTLKDPLGTGGPSADLEDLQGIMPEELEQMQAAIDQNIEDLYQTLLSYTEEQGLESTVSVTKGDGKVFVTFNESVFFDGDEWELRAEAKPILEQIAVILSEVAGSIDEVRMLGHTAQADPDRPNRVQVDRLLSAQRAANALAYMQSYMQEECGNKLDPARLVSEGYGQWRPVASNETPEGRAQNRRVEMIVSGRNLEEELKGNVQTYYTEN